MNLGKIFLHLGFLLSKNSIRINFYLTVGRVESLISRKNKWINLNSKSVSLNESFVHVLYKENQIALLLEYAKIAGNFEQTLQI